MAFLIEALSLYGRYFVAVVVIGFVLASALLLVSWWRNR
jgi:hypothetical protein